MIWAYLGPVIYIIGVIVSAIIWGIADQDIAKQTKENENGNIVASFLWPLVAALVIPIGIGWALGEGLRRVYRRSFHYFRARNGITR